MRRITILAVMALCALQIFPANARNSRVCNEQCSNVCERNGCGSEPCVDCNVRCAYGGGTDDRWRHKCDQWRSEGDAYLDGTHRKETFRRNGYGY